MVFFFMKNTMVKEDAEECSNLINKPNLHEAADTEINCIKYLLVFCFLVATFTGLWLFTMYLEPRLSLSISSIEGLSPSSSCQTCTTISPTFTLALYVDNSHNHFYGSCFTTGKTRVFYQLVEIAAGPIGEFCVDKSGKKNMTVHAWSMKLELPAFLRDQLYEETMKHEAVFDVELLLFPDPNPRDSPLILHFYVGN